MQLARLDHLQLAKKKVAMENCLCLITSTSVSTVFNKRPLFLLLENYIYRPLDLGTLRLVNLAFEQPLGQYLLLQSSLRVDRYG
ncbi:hypothetical protein VTO42DRAFT_5602 [Malbranchea cinnamomea]